MSRTFITSGIALAAICMAAPNDSGGAAAPTETAAAPAGDDTLTGSAGDDLIIGATPRDETAFSLDPFTNAPSSPHHKAATEAMQQLAKGQGEKSAHIQSLPGEGVDEAGYNEIVGHEDPAAALKALDPPAEV